VSERGGQHQKLVDVSGSTEQTRRHSAGSRRERHARQHGRQRGSTCPPQKVSAGVEVWQASQLPRVASAPVFMDGDPPSLLRRAASLLRGRGQNRKLETGCMAREGARRPPAPAQSYTLQGSCYGRSGQCSSSGRLAIRQPATLVHSHVPWKASCGRHSPMIRKGQLQRPTSNSTRLPRLWSWRRRQTGARPLRQLPGGSPLGCWAGRGRLHKSKGKASRAPQAVDDGYGSITFLAATCCGIGF
jgi:hypothetical protein